MREWALVIAVAIGTILATGHAEAGPAADKAAVKAVVEAFVFGRYMEGDCEPTERAGWEGFPTVLCTYTVDGAAKPAKVVLLDADNARLALWIYSACVTAGTDDFSLCATRLAKHINGASGAQFPVAGVVYEDIGGTAGVPEKYAFHDGVTAKFTGVPNGSESVLTNSELEETLEGTPVTARKFARIASTTREMWADFAGVALDSLGGANWFDAVRAAYQAAWSADENGLISAWAVANAASLSP